MTDDTPFYSPHHQAPRRQAKPGEHLFDFVRSRADVLRAPLPRRELRDHLSRGPRHAALKSLHNSRKTVESAPESAGPLRPVGVRPDAGTANRRNELAASRDRTQVVRATGSGFKSPLPHQIAHKRHSGRAPARNSPARDLSPRPRTPCCAPIHAEGPSQITRRALLAVTQRQPLCGIRPAGSCG